MRAFPIEPGVASGSGPLCPDTLHPLLSSVSLGSSLLGAFIPRHPRPSPPSGLQSAPIKVFRQLRRGRQPGAVWLPLGVLLLGGSVIAAGTRVPLLDRNLFSGCADWTTSPAKFAGCSPPTAFGNRAFEEVTEVKRGHKEDWCPYGKRRGRQGCAHTEQRPHEDTGGRWPSATQGGRPHQRPTLPTPWPQASGSRTVGR